MGLCRLSCRGPAVPAWLSSEGVQFGTAPKEVCNRLHWSGPLPTDPPQAVGRAYCSNRGSESMARLSEGSPCNASPRRSMAFRRRYSTRLNGGLKLQLDFGGMFGVTPCSLMASRTALVS